MYRNTKCNKCGRFRVELDGVCEKCLWDNDGGDYACITRPNDYTPTGPKVEIEDQVWVLTKKNRF